MRSAEFERAPGATMLPVKVTTPAVSAEMLAGAARERASRSLGADRPASLRSAAFRLPRWRVAEILSLPSGGATKLAIGGSARGRVTSALCPRTVGRPARDASFAVYGEAVQVVPARDGLELNVPQAARAILRAATRPTNRVARLTVVRARAGADDRRGARDGDRHAHGVVQDVLLGHRRSDHEPPARRPGARRHARARPAGRSRSTRRSASEPKSAGSARHR